MNYKNEFQEPLIGLGTVLRSHFVNMYKVFTVVAIVLFYNSLGLSSIRCIELFETPKNTGLFLPFPSDYLGLTFSLRDMFVFDQFGQLNKPLSATKLKKEVLSLPNDILLLRAKEIAKAIKSIPNIEKINAEVTYRIWMIFFAVDPQNAIREFKSQIMKEDSKPQMLQYLGEFLRAYDVQLARELAVELIRNFAEARKTNPWFAGARNSDYIVTLHPKKSISFMIKILMGYPNFLKSEATSNKSIRFGIYDKFIQSTTALFEDANVQYRPPTAKQVGTVINLLQQFLIEWSAKNHNEPASIVVRGSFINGLAVGRNTDLDIIIANPSLFQYFWNSRRFVLQDQIEKALQGVGAEPSKIFIDPGDPDPKQRLNLNDKVARESGFLNSVSFEIFPDHVNVLIHDHTLSPPGYPSFEIFRTE